MTHSKSPQSPLFSRPDQETLRASLTPEHYLVACEGGTEWPFQNAYWNNHAPGIYVDAISGEPLFSSLDKYDSGTGWPSFTQPLESEHVVAQRDSNLIEVHSKYGESHLGHVFDDGPADRGGLRYCINSASLRFIPEKRIHVEGFGKYAPAFEAKGITTDAPATEVALLAGGRFWGMEHLLRRIPGVIDTETGYAGGALEKPSYDAVSTGQTGHAESVQVTFDPKKLSYEELLGWFFRMHDPTTKNRQGKDEGTQYRSAIFVSLPQQQTIAERVRKRVDASEKWRAPVVTEIVAGANFTTAESEHQDYLVKHPDADTCHYLRD